MTVYNNISIKFHSSFTGDKAKYEAETLKSVRTDTHQSKYRGCSKFCVSQLTG